MSFHATHGYTFFITRIKFLAFKTNVEKQSRKAIKVLQMDNESRYLNTILKDFYKLDGIDL